MARTPPYKSERVVVPINQAARDTGAKVRNPCEAEGSLWRCVLGAACCACDV